MIAIPPKMMESEVVSCLNKEMAMIARHCRSVILLAANLFILSEIVGPSSACSAEERVASTEFELLRSDIRTKKMMLISERMELSGKEADAFWPIYRKYDVDLAAINDKKGRSHSRVYEITRDA